VLVVGTSFSSLFHFGFTTEELCPTVEKFCYLLNVPNSSEVVCPSPLDDVNDSAPAELFGLNRGKVLDMIQGCKIRPVGLVRTTMDTRCLVSTTMGLVYLAF
jgi:hypothetical protein